MISKEGINISSRYLYLLLLLIGCAPGAMAQDEYKQVIDRYKTENAVILNITEHLVIKNVGGKLVATSEVSKERLLISERSPAMYNTEHIYHSYFNQLMQYNAEALVAGDNGYKRKKDYLDKTMKSEDDNIFYDDSKVTQISFSGLTRYSVLKTSYTINHTDLHMLPSCYFQENIPAAKLVFMVTAPKYVQMKFVLKGDHTGWIKQAKDEDRNTVTYTFTAENVPALKEIADQPSILYYMPHVIPFITSYQLPKDDKPTDMLSSPAALYAYYWNFIKDVNLADNELLNKTVADITKGDKTDREKAAHIYKWVQDNIHYIAFEDSLGGFVPRQAGDICHRKFGDCKDMASILTAMCRKAGLKAYFTWIGTRHKPYTYEETPLPNVDNHMICALLLDGQWVFLDGTDNLIPFGLNPYNIQGKEALIGIDEHNFKIVKVPETDEQVNAIEDTTYLHFDGKSIGGRVSQTYHGYPAWTLESTIMYYKNEDREKYIKALTTRGSNKYVQNKYDFAQLDNDQKAARVSSDFTIDNYVQNAAKEYYINMNLNRNYEDNWIDMEDRNVPVSFRYKCKTTEVVVLDIPKGYKASYVPADASGGVDGQWSYKISYKTTPDKVILTKDYEIKTMWLPVDKFAENNKVVEGLKKQYKESIVLTAN
jgi:hypothetical protein